jgi:hypothetical protein
LTAVVLMLGFLIAGLTTSTRYSAGVVITSITVVGGLVGGFALAPIINRLAPNEAASEDREYQHID